jgi:hypothetical protein
MRKHGLAIQIVRSRAALHWVQIVLGAHESGAVVVLHHHATGAADDHRAIVIAHHRTPMMDDADRNPFDGRHGKIGG